MLSLGLDRGAIAATLGLSQIGLAVTAYYAGIVLPKPKRAPKSRRAAVARVGVLNLEILARRARVAELFGSGDSWKNIAETLGVSLSTVFYDRQALGLAHRQSATASKAEQTHATILACIVAGEQNDAIAARLGLHPKTVSRVRSAHRKASAIEAAPAAAIAPDLAVAA